MDPLDPKNPAQDYNTLRLLEAGLEVVNPNDPRRKVPEYGPARREFEPTTTIRPRMKDSVPPLFCTLYRKSGGARAVTVSEGRVTEVVPRHANATDDGIIEQPVLPADIWTGNLLTEHAITTGQVVGIAFTVDVDGYINSDRRVEVRDYDDRFSTHYKPKVGADTVGAPGDCFYILARLTGSGDSEKLETWHAGSNIEYIHDRPSIVNSAAATGLPIFKQYNLLLGLYENFGILADSPLKVEMDPVSDDLKWTWDGKGNFDLHVKTYYLTAGGSYTQEITINIPGRTVTTSEDGEHTHSLEASLEAGSTGSEHYHVIEDHRHDESVASGGTVTLGSELIVDAGLDLDRTGPYYGYELIDDGAHTHPITAGSGDPLSTEADHSHLVTIPAETVTAEVTLQGPETRIENSTFFTVCFRSGHYHSVVESPGALPAVTDGEPLIEKTIWTLDLDGLFDLADTTTPNVALL